MNSLIPGTSHPSDTLAKEKGSISSAYDKSMKRITISVPDEVATKALRAAEAGDVPNVSAYFTRLAQKEPDWVSARAIADEMAAKMGGVSEDDIAWAEETLGIRDREMMLA